MTKNNSYRYGLLLLFVFVLPAPATIAQDSNIIPYPAQAEAQEGEFKLTNTVHIYFTKECKKEALFLQQYLLQEHRLKLQITENKSSVISGGNIYLLLSATESAGREGYLLKVNPANITLTGETPAGVFYAVQSLRQLIQKRNGGAVVPCVKINDRPRFHWRAFLLDEARYFKGSSAVKQLMDEMALLKMNVFHWHLTDDQGWRIEIKKYPKLTEVGGKRKESETGTWLSNKFDGKPHAGFYTQQQIKDIIRYASDRHITIIPEIEMPGHASAAIAAYPWLGTKNKKMEVPTRFGVQSEVYNVVNPKVIQFLHDVLEEVMELFPSQIVHIGGDEVRYDQWKASAEVTEYMKKNNIKTPADLQISFTNSISRYLEQKKHRMMGWNEILGGHSEQNADTADAKASQPLASNVIIHFWTGDPKIVTEAVAKGYEVVYSYYDFTYMDYDYKTTPLEKAYRTNPVPETMPADQKKKILGMGCQMWGEWIPTVAAMNYKVYPRIAAYAEAGWTEPANKDYKRFRQTLSGYLINRWQQRGIKFSEEQF